MKPRVAFLGTGLMGAPMAARLLAAGFPVTAWNRTRAKAEPLAGLGAAIAAKPAEAIDGAAIICVILENGPAVESVLFGGGAAARLESGAVVIDLTSLPPPTARDYAARLGGQGVGYLDAPVSGGPPAAEAGTLAIMVGGAAADVARAEPVLSVLGRAVHVGPSGCGQLTKLGNQLIAGAALAAVAEALLLYQAGGADPAKARQALAGGLADSKVLQIHGRRMLERDFVVRGHVRTFLKDLDAAMAAAKECGLDLPMSRFVHGLFKSLAEHGHGELDIAAMLLEVERRNAPRRLGEGSERGG